MSAFILLLIFTFFFSTSFSQGHPAADDEFTGPFPGWINVKTQYGAIGDGIADETASLQAAFNAIGNSNSTSCVVYLPAGTYRITGTLTISNKISISVIGADPATTKIIWDGSTSGTMLNINGVAYSRFNRISWDGANKASIAIDQSWDGAMAYFDTGNEYADDEFKNVGIGIRGGVLGYGFAETAIMRCRFTSNSVAGISLGNFNALDAWVWNSVFTDCAIGVTNAITTNGKIGAGNFKVYNSIFRNSTTSDIVIHHTGEFAFRDNTSTNSQCFLKASLNPYPCHITLQSNTIIDPKSNKAIDILNHGPVILLDNIIRSRVGATGPVVFHSSYPNSDFFSMGNIFTVPSPIQSGGRNIMYDKPIVSASSLHSLSEQTLPGTQPNLNRTVFEIPTGSNAATIQNIINQAAALTGNRPIVHFAFGTYNIETTLHIPPNTDMQLVGDGGISSTTLLWSGGADDTVLNIQGPSKVTIRDLLINGSNLAKSITISNIDQVSSRVFMHEVEGHINKEGLIVNGLDNTLVLATNSRFSQNTGTAIKVTGGPLAANGNPQLGRTIMYGGLEWENKLSHHVTNGGNLLIRDVWYESGNNGPYLHMSGKGIFTVDGSSVASPRGTALPQISISNLSGKAAFINSWIQDRIAISGDGSATKVLGLGTVFGDNSLPVGPSTNSYIENTTTPSGDIRSFNSRSFNNPNTVSPRYGSFPVNNIGIPDSLFIASLLETLRNTHAQVLAPLPAGITDIRLYRVWLYNGTTGMELQGTSVPVSLYFRSRQSGNWNDINTWESSIDNTNWSAASVTPDFNSNRITILNNHIINVTSNVTVDETTVNSGGALTVSGGSVLTVNNPATLDGLILKSNLSGTARIGNSGGTVSGNVTVERYISNKRAWRLLGIPFSSSTQTIKSSWMEGAANSAGNPNHPYGTHITTFAGDPNAANFDAVTPASSIRTYSGNNFNSDAAHTPNTTSLITANQAYFLFVRGDRSVDRTAATVSSSATLRITGNVTGGNVTKGITGTNFSLIPNPYPSPIDFDAVKNIAANSGINKIYVWDANIGSLGQYRTIDITGTGPNYTYTATPGTSNNNWRFIESGTAFFIAGARTVDFTEATKSSGTPPASMLRTAGGTEPEISINLYNVNNNPASLADGVRLVFNNNYSAAIDGDDAKKIIGFDVNLGIAGINEILSIEKRPLPISNENIALYLSTALPGNYLFEIQPVNFSSFTLDAYLKDNYLNTLTPLNLTGDTKIAFSITSDAASAAGNRFSIVFSKPSIVLSGNPSITVYPNPVKDGLISLQFKSMPAGDYNIKLVNNLGQVVLIKQIRHAGGSGTENILLGKHHKGIYHIDVINPDNSKFSSKIIVN